MSPEIKKSTGNKFISVICNLYILLDAKRPKEYNNDILRESFAPAARDPIKEENLNFYKDVLIFFFTCKRKLACKIYIELFFTGRYNISF